MSVIKNKTNLSAQGLAYKSAAGAFSGLDGGTANNVLQSRGTLLAPALVKPNVFMPASGTFTATKSRGYILTAVSAITLPAAPSTGDTIAFVNDNATGVVITAAAGQVISIKNVISNYAGTATSITQGESLTLVYNASDTSWIASKVSGNWVLNTFKPNSITGGYIWMDGADPLGNGIPPTTGTNVLPVDRMGVKTFSQATAGLRPIYDSAVLNSLGCLKSTNASNTFLSIAASGVAYNTTTSFIMVTQPSSAINSYFFGGSAIGNAPAFLSNFAGVSYEFYDNSDRYVISAGATGFNLIEVYQTDATNTEAFLNGVSVFSNTPTVALNGARITGIFGSFPATNICTNYIAEFFIYRAILTAAQKTNIRRYIAQKWGLAIPS